MDRGLELLVNFILLNIRLSTSSAIQLCRQGNPLLFPYTVLRSRLALFGIPRFAIDSTVRGRQLLSVLSFRRI